MNRNLRAGNTSKDLCKKYPDFPNRYSENLLAISQGLTTEEFSSIKLLLQTNNIVTCKKLDTFENTQDIIAFLDRRGIISECDTSFLQQLLQTIGSIKLIKYTKTSNSGTVLCAQPSSTIKDDSTGEICNFGEYSLSTRRGIPAEVSVGNFTKLKVADDIVEGASATAMEDDDSDLQSSQGSITDDDKMLMIW